MQYPSASRFLLYEMRKIALGEFMDDLELSDRFNDAMGIQVDEDQAGAEQEKVGDDRLGPSSIF